MLEQLKTSITDYLNSLELDEKVSAINYLRSSIHEISPFKSEPVDCVLWVKNESVFANDYNPNSVAPPEMELLKLSIQADGYTQPIVSMIDESDQNKREVIDGFHRNRVGKECKEIQEKVHGYLPVVTIMSAQSDKADRMASTVRHNRARGKHSVTSMSDIVIELKRRNWTNEKIAKHLGMDSDEVLRLYQITSLSSLFQDKEFSMSWEPELIDEEEINLN